MRFLHLIFLVWGLVQSVKAQEQIFIDNVSVINLVDGKTVIKDVAIDRGLISQVGTDLQPDENVLILDGSQRFLMPGLIDAHIHLFQSGGLYTRPDAIDLTAYRPYEDEIQWLRSHAQDLLKRYLRCGITSVMDIGGPMSNYAIRDENLEDVAAASLFVTGPLISTYQPAAFDIEDPPIIKVNSAQEAIDLVQKQLPLKPDFIKIWYIVLPGQSAESTYEIVKATIEESHRNNLRVAVHATQLNTAKYALKAGADVLVHSVQDHRVDDDFIALFKKNNAVYIPTLIVGANYGKVFTATLPLSKYDFKYSHPTPLGSTHDLKHLENGNLLKQARESEKAFAEQDARQKKIMAENLKILQDNNIEIATGTDAGNVGTFHASSYYKEMAAMQEAGLSNAEILKASTMGGAAAVGKSDSLGTIEPGKIADLVVLRKNPLEDLEALHQIELIIKNGKIIAPDTVVKLSPEDLVQQQLNGYNARDINAFLAPYSDDFEIYNFPDELTQKGKANIKPGYAKMFENTPELHCEIINRISFGNTVIDQERVTGFGENDPLEALAIYKIEDGKIAKVYFIRKE
ncbi:MAG: amidohydrolase family protein [Saprospiraceae bacterium]|nr:amidohydrolase family protein [Saprospiraceae bacterium]